MHFGKLLFKIIAMFQRILNSPFLDISKTPPVALGILLSILTSKTVETKPSVRTAAEDSDQLGYPPSLIRVFTVSAFDGKFTI